MSKCMNCHKNEAVIFTTRLEDGERISEGLCLSCSVKMNIPGIEEMLKGSGISRSNVDDVQERINSMVSSMGGQDIDSMMNMMMNTSPEELADMMQNLKENPDLTGGLEALFLEGDLEEDEIIDEDDEFDESGDDPDDLADDIDDGADDGEDESNERGNKSIGDALQMMFGDLIRDSKSEKTGDELVPAGGTDSDSESESRQAKTNEREQRKRDRMRKFLNLYGTNLTDLAKEGKIEPIIGREKELLRVVQILNRRMKNNPVLLGEPGVGKTAIAEGLALRINDGDVPAKLLDMEVYLLDMTGMVAGTQFRGQFESRMKGVVDEAKKLGNIILVIDELHNIMGAGDAEGAMNAANILKPALARGEIRVLGSTTLDEYRRHIEKDSALERRFQKVVVDEPTPEETISILQGCRERYEKHHHVLYSDEVLRACVALSDRYISDRFLPDKAIDIMDEVGSKANLNDTQLVEYIEFCKDRDKLEKEKRELEELIARSKQPVSDEMFERQATLRSNLMKIEQKVVDCEAELRPYQVTLTDVGNVVEMWTGIPVQNITETEAEKLLQLEDRLHRRVVGQEKAVSALSRAIRRNRSGIGQKDRPSSFIFVGPTGVGKTELVKALAEVMFNDENALVRIDMSEFMEAHTVSKLIGSPPGYVGYDDGGQLTEKIRRKPYSVILLDEIEKAHADVFNILLQILDDGRLTDSHGRVVNFKDTIIVMTSNAGTSLKGSGFGFGASGYEAMESKVHTVLKEMFRPEFLNRVDEIVVFEELNQEQLREIVDLMLTNVKKTLNERGLELVVTDSAKDLMTRRGYKPKYGARPLRKTIQRMLEDPLSDLLLQGKLEDAFGIVADYSASNDQAEDEAVLSFDIR
ncbi:MAG: ATP-dependent Clp protease ATP-binding subunit [Fastidiosipilaceae bacterium]|jgi:ATP-dependent Clp protease ATP-binding subunit ClpC